MDVEYSYFRRAKRDPYVHRDLTNELNVLKPLRFQESVNLPICIII